MVKKLKWNLVLMSAVSGAGHFSAHEAHHGPEHRLLRAGRVVLACAAVQLIRYFVVERGCSRASSP